MRKPWVLLGVSLVLATSAGFLAATVFAKGAQTPQKIVTITLKNGEAGPTGPAGPAGPPGPKGDPGAITCPDGFVEGEVIINHPGGQVTIFGCIDK